MHADRNYRWLFCLVMLGGIAGARQASAAATLGLSTTTINNAAGQQIQVTINGADQVQGSDLYVQINDGGTANSGTSTAPTITTINMSGSGLLFAGDGLFESYSALGGLIAKDSIAAPSAISDASSILATITLNASALTPGSTFTISLADVAANGGGPFNTDMVDNLGQENTIVLSGTGFSAPATINVVPEPASIALLATGAIGLILSRRRRIA